MMNKNLIFSMCMLAVLSMFAQQPRTKENIDKNWKFSLGHAADSEKDFGFKVANIFSKSGKTEETPLNPKFNDSTWRSLDLPHDWAVELPFVNVDNFDVMAHGFKPVGGVFPETSVGWYRKVIQISEEDADKRLALTFDGIFRDAMVWINGFYLGNNASGYIGVTYDITDYVTIGGANTITVRVDATQYEGWFYEGAGIYRHVWLEKYDDLHLENYGGVFVYTNVEENKATVTVEATVVNETLAAATAEVAVILKDHKGNQLAKSGWESVSLGLNASEKTVHQLSLEQPTLWDLDNPYRYKLTVQVKRNGEIVDEITERFGLRTIEITNDRGVVLNGIPVKIQGVNMHQDHAGVGAALPDYLHYFRVKRLKEMGVNGYRMSHNPPAPELLEACDSLGMLVVDENRLLNSSPEYLSQLEKLIKRDRNHPSVFLWCIGNEEGWVQKNSIGIRIAQTQMAKQKELDPTRTSTYAADMANEYKGINTVIPVRGFNYREFGMVPYHNDHPEQPIIGTEMGSTVTTRGIYEVDSIRGYVPDQDITHPWWASRAEEWWPIAAENDYLLGGFIWTGFDYRGEPTPYEWPNINSHFGVMDVCGFPKNIYYYYQSWWTDKDVLHISPHWNWEGKEGDTLDVWVNANADKVELFLNGKSLGAQTMNRNSHLKWKVVYQPGKIKAVATKNGRQFSETVYTTGDAYQIVLTPDRKIIMGDGMDATVVDVTVLDKKGREVPDAGNLIQFATSENLKIIGVGNGDPSCHEADKAEQRSLFNGKCQVIIQSTETTTDGWLKATADGLKSAEVAIAIK